MPICKQMITKVFSWIGHKIARPRGVDWRVYARQGRVVDFTMLFFLIAVVGLGFYSPVVDFFEQSFAAKPDVVVGKKKWRVVYEGGAACASGRSGCLAEMGSVLWKSQFTLADSDYMSRVRNLQGKRFWTGVHFAAGSSELKSAATADAYQLVIGHINAPFRIYVNGAKRFEGDGKDFLPVSVGLTRADVGTRGVWVAIEVTHTLGSAYPLAIGDPYPAGFFSDLKARDWRNMWITTTIARPLALGITGLIVFGVFFFLWMSVKDRSEYLAYALFALCLFAIQLMHWGVVKAGLPRGDWYLLDMALRFSEGVFAGALGFTYARVRREIVFATVASGLFSFAACYYISSAGSDFLSLSVVLGKYYVPTLYALGAFSCFAAGETCDQESKRKGGDRRLDVRTNRLYIFGALLFVLGALYFNGAFNILKLTGVPSVWHRPIQLMVVAVIGAFIFRDYREFDFVMETSVQSRFHNPHLKEQRIFNGAMVHLDLKGSSALYDHSAERGLATKLPTLWCEGATQVIKTFGGEHLSSGGDSIFAFFPGDALDAAARAFLALREIEKFTEEFGVEIGSHLAFRGVVVPGAIRPIYKTVSGKRFEDYEDAPGQTLFKDASRLLEAEKSLGKKAESILVVEESLQFVTGKYFELIKKEKASVRDVGTRDLSFFRIAKKQLRESVA